MVVSSSPKRAATRCGSKRITVLRLEARFAGYVAGYSCAWGGQEPSQANLPFPVDLSRQPLSLSLSSTLLEAHLGHKVKRSRRRRASIPAAAALCLARAPCAPSPGNNARVQLFQERAGQALDDDWPKVLEALRRGLEDKSAHAAAQTAIAYVQLVYGRQLQQPADEQPADPLNVNVMTREERDALKRRILSQHPHLVGELRGVSED
jgi:hypothetical protein